MKKIISFFALSFLVIQLHAQGFSLGVKAGANFTTITSQSFDKNFAGGVLVGVYGKVKASDLIGVQMEGLLSVVRLRIASNATVFRPGLNLLKSTYIHIPILLNINPTPLLSLQVGPQIGLAISQTSNALQNLQNALKKNEYSLVSGIQLNLPKLNVFARYAFGLSDIRNTPTSSDSWKSRMIQAGVGISL